MTKTYDGQEGPQDRLVQHSHLTGTKWGPEQFNGFPDVSLLTAGRIGIGIQGVPPVTDTHSAKPYLKWSDSPGNEGRDTICEPIQIPLK